MVHTRNKSGTHQMIKLYSPDAQVVLTRYRSGTHQNPFGPNHPSAANMAPGMAGIPSENTSRAQSLRPNVIFLFNTTIKNAAEEEDEISQRNDESKKYFKQNRGGGGLNRPYICTIPESCVKCGICSTSCWKIWNCSCSTQLFG